MSDLISRQAAIDEINRFLGYLDEDMLFRLSIAIKRLPSAQTERMRGKWIRHTELKNIYGGKIIECSVCGEKYVVQYVEDEKYCRNCGADMRGREDG